jgi:hypothetical protein
MWISWAMWFAQARVMGDITRYIEDRENVDMSYGWMLLVGLMVNLTIEHFLDEHGWSLNIRTGFAYQQSVDAMIMKKMVKMTTATSKNYETG